MTGDIARFILDINEEWGVTVILIKHNTGVIMDISDRICALDFGLKIAEGEPAEVRQNEQVIKAYWVRSIQLEAGGTVRGRFHDSLLLSRMYYKAIGNS